MTRLILPRSFGFAKISEIRVALLIPSFRFDGAHGHTSSDSPKGAARVRSALIQRTGMSHAGSFREGKTVLAQQRRIELLRSKEDVKTGNRESCSMGLMQSDERME